MARARAVPGVEAVTVASAPPLLGGLALTVFPEGEAQNPNYRGSLVQFNDVSPDYFDALRIPLRGGRQFTEFDGPQSTAVAIVNEALARQLWPGQDPLHKRFTIVQETTLFEVIGVVATTVVQAVGESPTPLIYRPIAQRCSTRRRAPRAHTRASPRRCWVRCAIRCRPSTATCRCADRHHSREHRRRSLGAAHGCGSAEHLRRAGARARDDRCLRRDVVSVTQRSGTGHSHGAGCADARCADAGAGSRAGAGGRRAILGVTLALVLAG